MLNNCLSVLYKHIIQVENKNVGLKVGGGGHKHTIAPYASDIIPSTLLFLFILADIFCSETDANEVPF